MFWPTFLQLMAKHEWLKLSCLPLVIQIVADNYGYFQQTEGGVYSAVSITITLHCVCVPVRGEILDSTHSRWPQLKSRSWEPLKCSEWRVTVLLSLPLSFTPRRKEPSSPALLITAPLTARRDDLKSMKAPYNNLKYQWTCYRNAPLAHTQSPTRRSVALKQTSRLLSFWPSPLSPGSKSPIWLPEAFHGYIYSICIYIYRYISKYIGWTVLKKWEEPGFMLVCIWMCTCTHTQARRTRLTLISVAQKVTDSHTHVAHCVTAGLNKE